MADTVNWIPDDDRRPSEEAAGAPPAGGAGELAPSGEGAGASAPVEAAATRGPAEGGEGAPPIGPAPTRTGSIPDLSPVALAAGLVGLLTGPVLIGDPTARYVILVADLVALAFGALGVWASFRRFARLDYAVAAIVMGGISLFLWVSYVTDPPQGGT
jgi:hypothetical protein